MTNTLLMFWKIIWQYLVYGFIAGSVLTLIWCLLGYRHEIAEKFKLPKRFKFRFDRYISKK